LVVAIALLLGGVVLLFIDKVFIANRDDTQNISYPRALIIGIFQCLALMPGVSRSAATIIGGMTQGLTRKAAAEFSFFLAVPTMFAASGYKLLKDYEYIQATDLQTLLIGNVVAFIVAMLAIRFFIGFLTRYGFRVFGYYRILLGLVLLIMLAMGIKLEIE
jgi:undecaprenyl-diphosphatase